VKLCTVQLPGLNTPQFDWNLNKMNEHPMPVPPIFQPELPARAIAFLAEHPRRTMWVGVSTAYTILGERLVGYRGGAALGLHRSVAGCRRWDLLGSSLDATTITAGRRR